MRFCNLATRRRHLRESAVAGKGRKGRNLQRGEGGEDSAGTGKAGFLAYFGPDFLSSLAIKSTSIYRRWKRAILSILRKNFSP